MRDVIATAPATIWRTPRCLPGEIFQTVADDGNNDIAVARRQAAVHHQQIAIADPGAGHTGADHPHVERRRRIPDHQTREVKGALGVLGGG